MEINGAIREVLKRDEVTKNGDRFRSVATRWKKGDREVPPHVFLRQHPEYGALLDG